MLQRFFIARYPSRPAPGSRTTICWCLLLILFGSACREQDAPDTAVVAYTDDLGRSVEVDGPVDRVVTLAPNLTEIVYAAGGGGKLVGVSTADNFPPAVDTLPRFSALPVDFEKVLTLQPDVVLATDQVNNPRDADTFAALDIPMYFFRFDTVEDVISGIRKAGEIIGTGERAAMAADSLEAEMDALRSLTENVSTEPRVLVLIGDETLNAFGAESYVHELVELAGGRSLTDSLGTNPVLSEEFVLKARPDVIVGIWGDDYDVDRLLELHPVWRDLPAARHQQLYSLPGDLISRPGPRLIQGAQRLARLMHPNLQFRSNRPSDSTFVEDRP